MVPIETWTERASAHAALISPLVDPFLKRRSLGLTHAVHDFLFTYYSFSPTKLKQWVPTIGEKLVFRQLEGYPWLNGTWFQIEGGLLAHKQISENAQATARFIADLCRNVLEQPPRFGCFGLHEWAMVYKLSKEEVRHKNHRLRLSPEELACFLESQTLCCTHYDAYRFFTKEARPLNILNPVFDTRLELEQGGCLHANMDLYKWAAKLWPWIGSDFIAKTFLLALEGRELDMRASPYDLTEEGYSPIKIETEEGRKHYQKEQLQLAEKAQVLRKELLAFCHQIAWGEK